MAQQFHKWVNAARRRHFVNLNRLGEVIWNDLPAWSTRVGSAERAAVPEPETLATMVFGLPACLASAASLPSADEDHNSAGPSGPAFVLPSLAFEYLRRVQLPPHNGNVADRKKLRTKLRPDLLRAICRPMIADVLWH